MDPRGNASEAAPTAGALLETLQGLGVTHVVGIPDNGSAALFDRLAATGSPRLLTVTREGEAIAVAAGLWIGGAIPVVAIQNTGLLESGDSLRGTALRMGVPLLMLVGFRGLATLVPDDDGEAAFLQRADVDSVAALTEPTLDAWRIPNCRYGSDGDLPRLVAAWQQARQESRPVAVLQTRGLVP